MSKVPWKDFAGADIHDGDVIAHPSGERGKVIFLSPYREASDQWRVLYEEDEHKSLSRLCLQIGDKGCAVVVERAKHTSMQRHPKIHYNRFRERGRHYGLCKTWGQTTFEEKDVTCRRCWFHILADAAPWARGFLNDLREGCAQP